MKKLYVTIAVTGLLYARLQAQPYTVGDLLPSTELTGVVNSANGNLVLDKPDRKLVVLDFWSTNCTGCIAKIPELNELQEAYPDKLQIVMVNRQSKDSTLRFFNKRKKIEPVKGIQLVCGDSLLHSYFPHTGVPMHVWIDSIGRVQYITDGTIDSGLLAAYFSGKQLSIPGYVYEREWRRSLFEPRFQAALEYYSYLARFDRVTQTGHNLQSGEVSIIADGNSAIELYEIAFNENGLYDYNRKGRTILEGVDSNKYCRPADKSLLKEWRKKHEYIYELYLPPERDCDKYALMREDLHRYFGLTARVETRILNCIVLERCSDENKLATKGGSVIRKFYIRDMRTNRNDSIRVLQNAPYIHLFATLRAIAEHAYDLPFKDETGISGNIDIMMSGDALDNGDMDELRRELAKYDLRLVIKETPIEVLVIMGHGL
jgi:thiol-disulfide isomerase/thioredoxin